METKGWKICLPIVMCWRLSHVASPCIKKPGYGFQIHLISENKRNGMWPVSPHWKVFITRNIWWLLFKLTVAHVSLTHKQSLSLSLYCVLFPRSTLCYVMLLKNRRFVWLSFPKYKDIKKWQKASPILKSLGISSFVYEIMCSSWCEIGKIIFRQDKL